MPISAHQGQNATYEGPVDTQASINATFLNFDSVRPQLGVAVNLPTGTSYLPNNQRFARMDPDLVDIGSYGAGYNINPTAGFVIGLNKDTAMSFSAGYAWQGAFMREAIDLSAGVTATGGGFGTGAFDLKRKIDPGDVFTGNVNYTTQIGKLVLLGSFAYMSESHGVEVDDIDAGKAGRALRQQSHRELSDRRSLGDRAQRVLELPGEERDHGARRRDRHGAEEFQQQCADRFDRAELSW